MPVNALIADDDQGVRSAVKGLLEGARADRPVITRLGNASLLLKPEMTGNAKIFGGKRSLLDLLTRRLARYLRVEFWSWW